MTVSSATSNRALVFRLWNDHPDWPMKKIAMRVSLTVSRVRQILIEASLYTPHPQVGGKKREVYEGLRKYPVHAMIRCTGCGTKFMRNRSSINFTGFNFCTVACFRLWEKKGAKRWNDQGLEIDQELGL